jgi:hypothetical protein
MRVANVTNHRYCRQSQHIQQIIIPKCGFLNDVENSDVFVQIYPQVKRTVPTIVAI